MTPPISGKTAVQPAEERDWQSDHIVPEMLTAIGAALFEDARNLDIRLLWTRGRTTYFRVNWWTVERVRGPHIRRSAFVRVEREPGGYRVLLDRPLAA